jgi:molybdenum cofactor biosynthesis protein B
MTPPHPDGTLRSILCAVITVSDTRTQKSDRSGQMMIQLLQDAGHCVQSYQILKDEPDEIKQAIASLQTKQTIELILLNGGTGISPRDTTYDAIEPLLDKILPGFGELFRMLSYSDIGSRAMASRAIAGTLGHQLLFSMPGSSKAVELAMEKLILPEISHLVKQLRAE